MKLVDQFTYFSSNISSTESNVNICKGKLWTAIDKLSVIWKSDLSDKIKQDYFQAVAVSVQLYDSTTLIQTKYIEKKQVGTTQECDVMFLTNPGSSN